MGALSITGYQAIKEPFEPLVPGTSTVAEHRLLPGPVHGDDPKAFGLWAADQIAERIEEEGPETVAAVFLEPVQNAGGCLTPPPGYFQRVREICDRYGVLLVSDEVICAFGRLGPLVRLRALRLRARHDHRRQGDDLGLLALGGAPGERPAGRAFPAGHARRSRTASPLAGTRSPPQSPWPTSTFSRTRACSATCAPTRTLSAPRSSRSRTSRSSATCAATVTSTASSS